MLDKYIQVNEAKIICGQTSGGVWYCKELPANSTQEMDLLINETNIILNKYNLGKTENIKTDSKRVKGLD